MRAVSLTLVIASIALGVGYPLATQADLPGWAAVTWKGMPVAMLAMAALAEARGTDGRLLALVLALGALGDVLLVESLTRGALAFAAGHVVAIGLYRRNRRPALSTSQRALVLLLVPASVLIAWSLPADRAQAIGVAIYAALVAAMAAAAWASRFPRYRTGIGAMLFLVSDLLIFAELGPLGEGGAGSAIWLLYYLGQLLIFLGVAGTLRAGDDDLYHRL